MYSVKGIKQRILSSKSNYIIDLRLPKGEKEVVKSHAIKYDGSLNKFLTEQLMKLWKGTRQKQKSKSLGKMSVFIIN